MNPGKASKRVFFEPWSLGDVIIAAATLRELREAAALACHPMWHPLLRAALMEVPELALIAVDLPYTTRRRASPFDTGGAPQNKSYPQFQQVFSIRGDLRDLSAARKIFPGASIRMNGWLRFLGRKSAFINFPYSLGWPIQNRYRSWARLARISFSQIEKTYHRLQARAASGNHVVIHLGAQWRSKQFPEVTALRAALAREGRTVKLLAGPNDPLPPGLNENEIWRVADERLVAELLRAGEVITNDSGPMHLAAFLGCSTTAIVRTSPIEEWMPPATRIIRAAATPRGYRPDRRYMSDEVLPGWPSVSEILRAVLA